MVSDSRCPTRGVQLVTTILGSVTSLLLWPQAQDDPYRSGTQCLGNAWERSLPRHASLSHLGPQVTERQAGDTLCLVTHS